MRTPSHAASGHASRALDARLRRIRALSRLLDTAYRVPGTNFRIGIDPLLGLFPALGDLLSLGLSAYLLHQAMPLGCSRSTLVRMGLNVLIDAAVGAIPVIGDVFDFAWKANWRNLALLEEDLRKRGLLPFGPPSGLSESSLQLER
jgi:hypothetical protein